MNRLIAIIALLLFAVAAVSPPDALATNGPRRLRSNNSQFRSSNSFRSSNRSNRSNQPNFRSQNGVSLRGGVLGLLLGVNRNNFNNEFVVTTFIDANGDKIGVTNFGNEVLLVRNARLSDFRFSPRVGGFSNSHVSRPSERFIIRNLNGRRGH